MSRIELEYDDGSVETFFGTVPDGHRRCYRARRITLIGRDGARRVVKDREGATTPGATLDEYAMHIRPRSGAREAS